METYLLDLAGKLSSSMTNNPADRILNGSRDANDIEALLLEGSDLETTAPTPTEVWTRVYGKEKKGRCYVCDDKVKQRYYTHNGVAHRDEEGKLRPMYLEAKHCCRGWSVRQLLPNVSECVYNYQVVCWTCWGGCHLSCYHSSLLREGDSQAKQEAVTTLTRALEVSFR